MLAVMDVLLNYPLWESHISKQKSLHFSANLLKSVVSPGSPSEKGQMKPDYSHFNFYV